MKKIIGKTSANLGQRLIMALLAVLVATGSAQAATVTSNGDSGAGTLRQAIADAAPGETINFNLPGCPCTITLTSGELVINKSLTIQGLGANQLTVSGGGVSRVLLITPGFTVTLDGLKITGGNGSGANNALGGAINIQEDFSSGVSSTVMVSNSIISGNFAFSTGGAIFTRGNLIVYNTTVSGNTAAYGGAISNYSQAVLTVVNSTISDNFASVNFGAIENFLSTVTIVNSTISRNVTNGPLAGGIYNEGTLILNSSTVTGNRVDAGGSNFGFGGGIAGYSGTINNSIVAGNFRGAGSTPDDIASLFGIYSASHSLIGNATTSGGIANGVNGNIVGNAGVGTIDINSILNTTLADNGGPTYTHALIPGSPAIDSGDATLAAGLTTDQRGAGFPRIFGAAIDIGAYELSDLTPPMITPNVSGTLGSNGWYVSNVQVSWSVVDNESVITGQTVCATQTVTSDTVDVTFTCSATSAGDSSSQSVTIKRDATDPVINFSFRTPPNANGWNNGNVLVQWSCSDATSGMISSTASQVLTGEGANQSRTGTCTDIAGNSASDTQTGINIDKTAPVLNPTVSPNPVLLNAVATADANATDALSGIASQSCAAVDTSSVGFKSVTCSATDLAGNAANASANYQVVFNSLIFLPLSDLLSSQQYFNQVTAGSDVPIRFSLGGFQGDPYSMPPTSQPISCVTKAPLGAATVIDRYAPDPYYSSLFDFYQTTWRTQASWKFTCRRLTLYFKDGTTQSLDFYFK